MTPHLCMAAKVCDNCNAAVGFIILALFDEDLPIPANVAAFVTLLLPFPLLCECGSKGDIVNGGLCPDSAVAVSDSNPLTSFSFCNIYFNERKMYLYMYREKL